MTDPAPAPVRRKRILVQRGIQFRFARFVILFAVVTSVVTSAIVFFTTFSLLGAKLANVYPQGRLAEVFRGAYANFFLILLAALPFIFYFSIRYSHRLVGPLPKIYEALRKVGKGDFGQRVHLRKNDELNELAVAVNEMIEDLQKRQSP